MAGAHELKSKTETKPTNEGIVMLAQNFKTAEELFIGENEREALIAVLGMLEREELVHDRRKTGISTNGFNMECWYRQVYEPAHKCGTVGCIGGWAETIGKFSFDDLTEGLDELFHPGCVVGDVGVDYAHITTANAATALRNYLTNGAAKWAEVLRAND